MANGVAQVLAIGTAVPSHAISQEAYPDWFFDITDSNDNVELKDKFQKLCRRSEIKKRHHFLTKEFLEQNPSLCAYSGATLDLRQRICVKEIPQLGKEAADRAVSMWGQPVSKITHIVVGAVGGVDSPGADFRLIQLLGLNNNVKRVMIYQQGCFVGGTTLRIAKDLAENNKGARVLVVCSEVGACHFRAPNEDYMDGFIGAIIFGDGAGALILGCDPDPGVEKPIFEVKVANQAFIPNSEDMISCNIRERGITYNLKKNVGELIANNIGVILKDLLKDVPAKTQLNDLFWVVHPGGRNILDKLEQKFGLKNHKLSASRSVLENYGNMLSCSVFFVLEEMWKSSKKCAKSTTGEGHDWGILLGIGPGITVEAILMKSVEN